MEISNSTSTISQSNLLNPNDRRGTMKAFPNPMAIMRSAEVIKRNSVNFGLINTPEDSQSYIDYLLANAKNNYMKKKLLDIKEILINVDFNVNKVRNLEILSEILNKAPTYRASHDLMIVEKAFSNTKFFRDISTQVSKDSMKSIYKNIKYMKLEKHEKLFDYGDEGDNFYIILKGKVFVMIPRTDNDQHDQTPNSNSNKYSATPHGNTKKTFTNKYNSPISNRHRFEYNTGDSSRKAKFSNVIPLKNKIFPSDIISTITQDDVSYFVENYSNLQCIKQLVTEESFGEIALREKVKRTATIIANDETHLAVLSKEDFKTILKHYYDSLWEADMKFMKECSYLDGVSKSEISSLLRKALRFSFKYNECIYREGDLSNYIYFIRNGEIEFTKSVNETPKANVNGLMLTRTKKNIIKTGRLTTGELFGENEIIGDFTGETRQETGRCISSTSDVFAYPIEVLESLRKFPKILKNIRETKRVHNNISLNRQRRMTTLMKEGRQKGSMPEINTELKENAVKFTPFTSKVKTQIRKSELLAFRQKANEKLSFTCKLGSKKRNSIFSNVENNSNYFPTNPSLPKSNRSSIFSRKVNDIEDLKKIVGYESTSNSMMRSKNSSFLGI